MAENKISYSELSLFCYQLHIVLKSGLPLVDAMEIIKSEIKNKTLLDITEDVSNKIIKGEKITSAIKSNDIFPKYFVYMVEIAEKTGNLEQELLILSDHYEKKAVVEKKINNAVTYPAILLFMMLAVVGFLIINVIPMFAKVLKSFGTDIPNSSKWILNIGLFLNSYGIYILVFIVLLLALFLIWKNSKTGKIQYDKFKLSIPIFGELNKKILTSNFSDGMAMMIHSGMNHHESLELIKGALENSYIENKLSAILEKSDVKSISDVIEELGYFPTLFKRIISLGEKSGELESSFNKTSSIYKEDVQKNIDHLTSKLEPVLVIILSVIIGIILLSVMIPFINIITQIG